MFKPPNPIHIWASANEGPGSWVECSSEFYDKVCKIKKKQNKKNRGNDRLLNDVPLNKINAHVQ